MPCNACSLEMRPRGSLKVATPARAAFNLSVPNTFFHCDKDNPFNFAHVILTAKIANGSLSYIFGYQDLREVRKAAKIARCVVHMTVRILLQLGMANSALMVVCYSRKQKILFHSSENQYHCFERDQHLQMQGLLTFLTSIYVNKLFSAVCGMCKRHLRFLLQFFRFVVTRKVPMLEGHGGT
jgi:hypothetical protein